MISKELLTFLESWLEHTHSTKEHSFFRNNVGLCSNLTHWCNNVEVVSRKCLLDELYKLLEKEFGVTDYPFGREDYIWRSKANNQQYNWKRVEWVQEKIRNRR